MKTKGRDTIKNFKRVGKDMFETDRYIIWKNNIKGLTQITVARKDGNPVESWYDLWNIKNHVTGDESLGIEVYPPRKDLIDGENQRHIFVLPVETKDKNFKDFASVPEILRLLREVLENDNGD